MKRQRRRKPRRQQSKITPLHYLNLGLTALALLVILLGLGALGDQSASCFFDISQKQ